MRPSASATVTKPCVRFWACGGLKSPNTEAQNRARAIIGRGHTLYLQRVRRLALFVRFQRRHTMSIVDKAVETVTKNVSLEIKLKDAEAKIGALQKEVENINASLSQAEDKNASLEKKIIELQGGPLVFDEKTGTFVCHTDGLRYCAKCKSQDIRSPLKNCDHGWRCPACNRFQEDPERPKPKQTQSRYPSGGLGKDSWMER